MRQSTLWSRSLLALLLLLPTLLVAQQHRVVLSIKPKATEVKFVVRLSASASSFTVQYGQDEQPQSIAYQPEGAVGMTVTHRFGKALEGERRLTIEATELRTLRVTNASKSVNGILEVVAPKLENLFADNTSLEAHPTLDLSQAPMLEALSMTYTGLEHVVLPKTKTLTSVAISPTLAEHTYLKSINVGDAPMLTQLSIGNHELESDTLDLRANKRLKVLNVSAGLDTKTHKRKKLRALLGIKELVLERFLGQNNELGMDQLPDRAEETPLEQFLYGNQRNYKLHSRYIKGLTIDLKHLYAVRGVLPQKSLSSFEWMYQTGVVDGKPKYAEVPKDKIRVKDGCIFTFDESILKDGEQKVYFRVANDGYPSIGRYNTKDKTYSHKLVSYVITIAPVASPSSRVIAHVGSKAGAPVSLRLAATSGVAHIKVGHEPEQAYTVGTSLTSATPITLRPKEDAARLEIRGDLILLDCSGSAMKSLDLSQAPTLELLDCSRAGLSKLDASACKALIYLYAMDNELETATLGKLEKLRELNLSFNSLSEVDLSGLPALTAISLDKNRIKTPNFSHNRKLEKLYCKSNGIRQLDLDGLTELTELSCESNKLQRLNLSGCAKLEKLYCKNNELTAIDLGHTPKLQELHVGANALERLEVSSLADLKELYCFSNKLTRLDLSHNRKLETLSAGDNKLTEVGLQGLEQLETLSLGFNQLASLSVEGCRSLAGIELAFNRMTLAAAQAFVATLPMRSTDELGMVIYHNKAEYPDEIEHNQSSPELASMAKRRGWLLYDGETPLPLGLREVASGDGIRLNVVAGELIVEASPRYADELCRVYDLGGQVHLARRGQTIYRLALAPGQYLLRWGDQVEKVIVPQ